MVHVVQGSIFRRILLRVGRGRLAGGVLVWPVSVVFGLPGVLSFGWL